MYENEVFPYAHALGISWEQFWHINPRILSAFEKGYEEKIKQIDYQNWLNGNYIYSAFETVMSHFSAGLSGKKSEAKYIDKPILQMVNESVDLKSENKRKAEQLFMNLQIMQQNFELDKRRREENEK